MHVSVCVEGLIVGSVKAEVLDMNVQRLPSSTPSLSCGAGFLAEPAEDTHNGARGWRRANRMSTQDVPSGFDLLEEGSRGPARDQQVRVSRSADGSPPAGRSVSRRLDCWLTRGIWRLCGLLFAEGSICRRCLGGWQVHSDETITRTPLPRGAAGL